MNRKSKIIVSVVGISIVLLALLGITYAYYLTRIQGNTNTNSISVTTADLKLVYGDGNGLVTANDIMPGTTITKTFTVTNAGDSKVKGYAVVIEEIDNTLTRKDDLTYTLVCKLNDGTNCGGVIDRTYPSEGTTTAILKNDIDSDVVHNYTLTVTYVNHENIDQSEDMGSTINGKINIKDGTQVSSFETNSLAYNLVNKYGGENEITTATNFETIETGMYKAKDDYGISYYLSGNVTNNYVKFGTWLVDKEIYDSDIGRNINISSGSNMYWRILRINGDGSIRLIYDGTVRSENNESIDALIDLSTYGNDSTYCDNDELNSDFLNYKYSDGTDSNLKSSVDNWFSSNMIGLIDYISSSTFCNDKQLASDDIELPVGTDCNGNYQEGILFAGAERVEKKQPILECYRKEDRYSTEENIGNGDLTYPVGVITADEALMAGVASTKSTTFMKRNLNNSWTMTPYGTWADSSLVSNVFDDDLNYGYWYDTVSSYPWAVRPVINLKADVPFAVDDDGTYVITTS